MMMLATVQNVGQLIENRRKRKTNIQTMVCEKR